MNVAQLKLRECRVVFKPARKFPRLNERGSIEAPRGGTALRARGQVFPRLNERGSIEAQSRRGKVRAEPARFHV